MFSRIFSNTKVRSALYILKDIREYGVQAKLHGLHTRTPTFNLQHLTQLGDIFIIIREIFENQQEITTITVIWARQLVSLSLSLSS